MTQTQPLGTSSLSDIDYEEPNFESTEAKFFLDPTKLTDRLCTKANIQQDKSKVLSDLDAVPVALVLRVGMFE